MNKSIVMSQSVKCELSQWWLVTRLLKNNVYDNKTDHQRVVVMAHIVGGSRGGHPSYNVCVKKRKTFVISLIIIL